MTVRRVTVFCGSSPGARPEYLRAARAFGALLAGEKLGLVYGGAHRGLMGALADAALAAGGEVVGVIPRALADLEIAHKGLTALHVVDSMHARKAKMAELGDAFVALPGGLGTLEELAEIATWAMLGIHDKPLGLLDVGGYFDGLAAFLDHATREGFLRPEHRALLHRDDDAARLLERLRTGAPAAQPRWLRDDET